MLWLKVVCFSRCYLALHNASYYVAGSKKVLFQMKLTPLSILQCMYAVSFGSNWKTEISANLSLANKYHKLHLTSWLIFKDTSMLAYSQVEVFCQNMYLCIYCSTLKLMRTVTYTAFRCSTQPASLTAALYMLERVLCTY